MLLKSGRDYQIKYYNNINANKDGELKRGNGEGANFNPELPYVEIIGKGNYTDAIKNNAADAVKEFQYSPRVDRRRPGDTGGRDYAESIGTACDGGQGAETVLIH